VFDHDFFDVLKSTASLGLMAFVFIAIDVQPSASAASPQVSAIDPNGDAVNTSPFRKIAADHPSRRPSPAPQPTQIAFAPFAPQSRLDTPAKKPLEIVDHLKESTVYVKLKIGDRLISTGTGFVVRIEPNGDIWIATNRHVAVPDLDELPEGSFPSGSIVTTEIVFRSGQPDEQSVKGELIAEDPSGEIENDIAFLRARKVQRPPQPIAAGNQPVAREGQSYIGGGFPLGGSITQIVKATSNPSITITKGSVSAVRRDDHFKSAKILQVDGSLQPGNSGGPIVDADTGHLIGMAVARSGAADTIGFIIPTSTIRQALEGCVGNVEFSLENSKTKDPRLAIHVQLFDPSKQVRNVTILIASASDVDGFGPAADGSWQAMPNSNRREMNFVPGRGEAKLTVPVDFDPNSDGELVVYVQTCHRNAAGSLIYHTPHAFEMNSRSPKQGTPSNSGNGFAGNFANNSIQRLGPLIDSSKDSELVKNDSRRTISITVPSKPRTMSLELSKSRKPLNNAPMTLSDVQGDFVALVEVSGEMNPGTAPVKLPKSITYRLSSGQNSTKLPLTYQGAGLILFQDSRNHIRIERACYSRNGSPALENNILIEVVRDGRQPLPPSYVSIPETGKTIVGIVRKQGKISCLVVIGENVAAGSKELALDFDDKIKVGLVASNLSQFQFEAEFKNFMIIDDPADLSKFFQGSDRRR
jgi:S1-C subfamily serine protease